MPDGIDAIDASVDNAPVLDNLLEDGLRRRKHHRPPWWRRLRRAYLVLVALSKRAWDGTDSNPVIQNETILVLHIWVKTQSNRFSSVPASPAHPARRITEQHRMAASL